ncbi:MAG: spore coat protein YlbD [Bacilli bacterium]
MNRMEEFQKFIAANPSLKTLVDNKDYTWQELYDRYLQNGEKDPVFLKHINGENNENESSSTLSSFFDALTGVDIDKVAEGLNSMKKILNVISEVTSSEPTRKKNTSFIKDDD